MQQLLEAIRRASLPGIWSQGVKLAREGAVALASSTAGEVTVRVRAGGRPIAPTVTLYIEGQEWSCDCDGKVDPCMHVAAAIIAFAKWGETGDALVPAPNAKSARLVYRLGARDRLLTVARVIVHGDGREERLVSLASDLARGKRDFDIVPTHDDLRVDRIVGTTANEVIAVGRVADLFDALSSGAEVTFDGAGATVSAQPVLPHARVEDSPDGGFVLHLERDPAITQVIAKGVVRCDGTLRPMGELQTTGELLERLPLQRTFAHADLTELVTKVLPALQEKIPVRVATKRLPRAVTDVRPRLAMDLSHRGHTLSILPTLVYGDPPLARVEGEAMVTFGDQVPMRRLDEERELVRRLRDDLNLVHGRRVDLDGTDAVRFAAKLRDWQLRMGDAAQGAAFESTPLGVRMALNGDTVEIFFECDGQDERTTAHSAGPKRASAAAVLQSWQDGLGLVPLEGGGWAPLPVDWLTRHGHLVADLLAARDTDKRIRPAAMPTLGALCDALDVPRPPQLERLAPLLDGFDGIPRAAIPKGVKATLRVYQQQGVDWLSFLRDAELGSLLADDMGLGKTLQTICILRGRALVVCPKSVVYNWASEIERFRPELRTAIYHGQKRELDPTADVTLTTYALLRLDPCLAQEEWSVIVLDEAQAIKNPGSQTARAAFDLRGKFRIALTGTPVENRLEELWSVMHFTNPGLLGGASDFQQRYSAPIAIGDKDAAIRLRARIRPFVLRRTKREVLPELPPRTDSVLHVELDEVERTVYDAVRVATKQDVADKLAHGGGVLAALEALLRLRQAACHAKLVPGQNADRSSKIDRLLEALEELLADGHKALVFSQWTSLLDLVEPHLSAAGIRFARLDGTTHDRAGVVRQFQDDDGPPLMLVSLKAGGTGLNLTAADHVFLLDPWWNPAVEDQAADRAHRIGQDRPVMVYRMVAKDTVEEGILALQEKKRRIAGVALGEADQAGGITKAELLALLD